jgi:hypothetical protein
MLLEIMNWIVIQFGKNPKNVGSPPNDNSVMNTMNFINSAFLLAIITSYNDYLNLEIHLMKLLIEILTVTIGINLWLTPHISEHSP